MKKIDIKNQPSMGLKRTFSLTLNGIRYRLFRSVVTMIVITVAIAFLVNSLTEGLVKRAMLEEARKRVGTQRVATKWVARLSLPDTVEGILNRAAKSSPGDAWLKEAKAFAALSDQEITEFVAGAGQASSYLAFFAALGYDDRRQIVHTASGTAIFDRLQDPANMQRFDTELAKLLSVRFVSTASEFQTFCGKWKQIEATARKIQAGHAAAAKKVAAALTERNLLKVLADRDEAFVTAINAAGYQYSTDEAETVADQARVLLLYRLFEKRMGKQQVKKMISAELNTTPDKVTQKTLWHRLLKSRRKAEWVLKLIELQWKIEESYEDEAVQAALKAKFPDAKNLNEDFVLKSLMRDDDGKLVTWFKDLEQVKKLGISLGLEAEEAVTIADRKREVEKLLEAERKCGDAGEGMMGVGKRMGWLLLVSLVVCTVGITNAMLMTVTERFREIATLKCLGALDSFIMMMFVIEACVLGVCGGTLGAILGIVIGVLRMRVFVFGWVTWWAVRPAELALAVLAAIVVGVVLAALAAVYPSLKASRLAPMEAMRIE